MNENVDLTVNFMKHFKIDPEPHENQSKSRRWCRTLTKSCKIQSLLRELRRTLPVIDTLRNYNVRESLFSDVMAGATVGIMQIPQGMAYAMLSSLPPIVGLYISFFSPLVYLILGTSHQLSMGCITVVSMMFASVLQTVTVPSSDYHGNDSLAESIRNDTPSFASSMTSLDGNGDQFDRETAAKIQLASALSIISGLTLMVLAKCRFGLVANYMSAPMVSGFTTAVAVHVMTNQMKHIFGVTVSRHDGMFKIVKTWAELITSLPMTNVVPLIISGVSLLIMYLVKVHVNQRFKKRLKIPIPIEIILVAVSTILTHFCQFHDKYQLSVVETIPAGFPRPRLPVFKDVGPYVMDGILIGIVSFTQSVSVAKILGSKHGYFINPSQEMFAYATGSLVCGFFSGYIPGASVSRSMIQDGTGGKTQLTSFFGCAVVLIVIMALGPLLFSLPKCVLAAIILINLKAMFMQFEDIKTLWRKSQIDLSIWLVTFLSTVVLDADIGIIVGISFSMVTVVLRLHRSSLPSIGYVEQSDVYKPSSFYSNVQETPGIIILQYQVPIFYGNADIFVKAVRQRIDSPHEMPYEQALIGNNTTTGGHDMEQTMNLTLCGEEKDNSATMTVLAAPCVIILDMEKVNFIDSVGVAALEKLIKENKDKKIKLLLSSCTDNMLETLERCGFLSLHADIIYITTKAAVKAAYPLHSNEHELNSPLMRSTSL